MATTEDDPINDKPMPLLDHLIELRTRLIWAMVAFGICFAVSYYFSDKIYYFLARPLARDPARQRQSRPEADLHPALRGVLHPHQARFLRRHVPGFSRSSRASCGCSWHLACTAARSARCCRFLLATPVLFILGAALAYFFVFPVRLAVLRQLPDPDRRRRHTDRVAAAGRANILTS